MKNFMNKAIAGAMIITSITATTALAAEEEVMVIAPAPTAYTVTVNGKTLDMTGIEAYRSGDHIMVPVRAVAESLGFKVSWDAEYKGVKLDNGVINTILYIGTDSYYNASSQAIGMSAPTAIGAAPEIVNDTTYVPIEMFDIVYNNENAATVDGNTIKITSEENRAEMPNPFVDYESIADATKAISFESKLPEYIPEGYNLDNISVMSGDMLQIIYSKDSDCSIYFRSEKTTGDISGDYNMYENSSVKNINGVSVTIKINEDTSNAIWQDGDIAYSVFARSAISEQELVNIVSSVK